MTVYYSVCNKTINQLDLTDIYKMLQQPTAKYTFFSGEYGLFSRTGYILDYKTSPNKFKRFEVIQNMTSDHNGNKLESVKTRKFGKFTNMWILNTSLLNN